MLVSLPLTNDYPDMTSSLFTFLITNLGLHKLPADGGIIADLLIGLRFLECACRNAFCMLLIGNGIFRVA